MEYRQITSEIYVPERTAELADKHPGVMALLRSGHKILSYLDERDLAQQETLRERPTVVTEEPTMRQKRDDMIERTKEQRIQGEQ